MSRHVRYAIVAAAVMFLPIAGSAQLSAPPADLHAALHAARDADLKGDWDGLLDVRARIAASEGATKSSGLTAYYLGYIDWRLSSLAVLVTGPAGMRTLLDRAVEHLRSSVAAQPALVEAQALLAMCAGILGGTDPSRLQTLTPVIKDAWSAALEQGATNPRVQLLRAMTEVFAPPQFGGDRERGLERWKEAIRLFEAEQRGKAAGEKASWGHAEAWAWLGGAYLTMGRHEDARAALAMAVRLRPDFWWASKVALPQARRPIAK